MLHHRGIHVVARANQSPLLDKAAAEVLSALAASVLLLNTQLAPLDEGQQDEILQKLVELILAAKHP